MKSATQDRHFKTGTHPQKGRKGSYVLHRIAPPSRIRIVVADDHPMDRQGLACLLDRQPDFTVVGESATSAETVEICERLKPKLLIYCSRFPGCRGVPVIDAVRIASGVTRVLVVADRSEERCLMLNPHFAVRHQADRFLYGSGEGCLLTALSQGALGVLRRSCPTEMLFEAVRTVASGHAWSDPGTLSRLLDRARWAPFNTVRTALSDRERQVARLIVQGCSNKEIAAAIRISEPTVKKHIGHLLSKLQFQDRLQLGVFFARNPQLLPSESDCA